MKKIETLKLLLEKVTATVNEEVKFANGSYCEGDCTCVIGQILLIGGATMEQLFELDKKKYYNSYGIRHIIGQIIKDGKDDGFVKEILEKLGFDLKEDQVFLGEAQGYNDDLAFYALKKHIENKIHQEELAGGMEQ